MNIKLKKKKKKKKNKKKKKKGNFVWLETIKNPPPH